MYCLNKREENTFNSFIILYSTCILAVNCVCACFPSHVSGNGEARSSRASRPDPDPGPGTRPAHISEQRGPPHPGRPGGNLATRPAALPASQWPPAQLPAQRQHARLRER